MTVAELPVAIEPILTEAEVRQFWDEGYLLLKAVISREEAARCRDAILNMVPRDLSIPPSWRVHHGRIKPYLPSGSHTIDLPELMFLYGNEKLYRVATQLLECAELRASDASLGITLRNDSGDPIVSQSLHLDASVPQDVDFTFELAELQIGGCFYFSDVEPRGGGIHVVPGGPKRVEAICRQHGAGARKLYNNWKRFDDFPSSVEVTGEAGDFALLHHLMPHAASHNRTSRPRVARFQRYTRVNHLHSPARPCPPDRFNADQLRELSPLNRAARGVQVGTRTSKW